MGMKRNKILAILVIAVLVASGAVVYALLNKDADKPSAQGVQVEDKDSVNTTAVTKIGTIGCLAAASSGPQTMECALGLTEDDGTTYALRSEDPTLIGSIPTGQRIEVTGLLSQQANSSKYKTSGTIAVESVRRL